VLEKDICHIKKHEIYELFKKGKIILQFRTLFSLNHQLAGSSYKESGIFLDFVFFFSKSKRKWFFVGYIKNLCSFFVLSF